MRWRQGHPRGVTRRLHSNREKGREVRCVRSNDDENKTSVANTQDLSRRRVGGICGCISGQETHHQLEHPSSANVITLGVEWTVRGTWFLTSVFSLKVLVVSSTEWVGFHRARLLRVIVREFVLDSLQQSDGETMDTDRPHDGHTQTVFERSKDGSK